MATQTPRERAPTRARRWGKRLAKCLGALFVLSLVAVFVLVHNLDRPWVKRRVQAVVAKEVGVDIDYGSVHLALSSGIDIDDLVVSSPPEMRKTSPDLARMKHVVARWSPRSLVANRRLERLTLTDVAVTIAVDENGRSSLDALSTQHLPRSRRADSLLSSVLHVRDARAERLTVTVVQSDHGAVVERTALRGLELELHNEPAQQGVARLRLGSTSSPLDVELERHGTITYWRASGLAVASSSDAVSAIELSIGARAFHVAGRARFDVPRAQTDVMLDAEAAEGSARGFVTIPDEGDSVLRRVVGDLDAAGLIDADRAHLRYRIAHATLATPPRLDADGVIEITGDVANLRLPLGDARSVRVDAGALDVHVLPDTAAATLHGTIDLRFASLHATDLDARNGHLSLRMEALRLDRDRPLASTGELALTGEIDSVASPEALASTLAVNAHARLTGHAPYAGSAEVTAKRLQLVGRVAPARIAVDVTNAIPDGARPIASTGVAHVEIALGDATAAIDATKDADAIDYELRGRASSLERARALLPARTAALFPLERMALAVESKGRVEGLASAAPEIHHHTKLDFDRPGIGRVSARSLAMTVDSHGSAMKHDARIDLRARALSVGGSDGADEHATISVKFDRAAPTLRLVVETDGRTTGKVVVAASFVRARRAIVYDATASASKLAHLEPLLAGVPGLENVDLSDLAIGLSAKGELFGVVADVAPDGALRIEPHPSATVALRGPMDVHVEHFGFVRRDLALKVPKLAVHADFGFASGRRTVESDLDIGGAHFAWGAHEVEVARISDHFSATVVGDLRNPDADVKNHVTFAALRQEFVPAYPTSDVSVDLSARRDHAGVVRVDDLRLETSAGGTKLAMTGDLDVSGARRRLALHGELDQDVARMSTHAGELAGRGRASASIDFESSDLVEFRVHSAVHVAGVDLSLPREGIAIESLDGEIPVNLDFRAAKGTVTLLRGRASSPFELLRFVDQQPLLGRTSFVSARRVTTPYGTFAPVVGNLEIERNVVSLSQAELGFRGGRLGGECTLDYAKDGSTFEVHVRAKDVRSSRGEPFDGNAAFLVSTRDSSVDGRGQILRISKREFEVLLDEIDAPHKNASINRVRSALKWGYPARVNLTFNHGFANAHVELGGLAALFRVGDIRGIPTGPVFERLLHQWHVSKGRR